jgi:type II secretory pathway pseudopilin PulG
MHTPLGGVALRRRPRGGARPEEGFTVLELLVVVGVIAILIGIGVPTFFSAQQRAQHHGAQAVLRTALEAANAAYANTGGDFSQVSAAVLAATETSVRFADAPVSAPNNVGVLANLSDQGVGFIALASPAGDGTCWYIFQTNDSAPGYGTGAAAGGRCDPHDALGFTAPEFPT